METEQLTLEDKKFWFKEMDEWREKGDRNVFEFPGMIRALGFGGISKKEANDIFTEWTKTYKD